MLVNSFPQANTKKQGKWFMFPGTILKQFGHWFIYFECTQLCVQIKGLVNYCQWQITICYDYYRDEDIKRCFYHFLLLVFFFIQHFQQPI